MSNAKTLATDYLIIGSGAVGMAFADILVTETEADIVIIDRFAKPGGHWNVAYPFVTLHQPSAFYGVSSMELSSGKKDEVGWNKGLHELASGAEVSAYFDNVMRQQLLPSGRVRYFPLCDYKGDGRFVSLLTGEEQTVTASKKTVDCTYLKTTVPATHTPNYTITKGVNFMPLNDLVNLREPVEKFVIIGGGKTGIDACLWLLENQVNPDCIMWIVSRDAWLIDRQMTQPSDEFFEYSIGNQADQFEAIVQATDIPDLFERLEACGALLRIDPDVTPSMFHGATISQMELAQLRKIKNIVRMGRVESINLQEIVLNRGSIPTQKDWVHVDCSASAISNLAIKPIFQGDLITPQTVRSYQPVFSAAVIAHVEVNYDNNAKKNELCQVVPLPNHDTDWISMRLVMMMNQYNWGQDKELRRWVRNNRLDGFGRVITEMDRTNEKHMAIMQRIKMNAMPAAMKLQQLAQQIPNNR